LIIFQSLANHQLSIINNQLNFFQSFQAETVGHPRNVVADSPLESLFFDETLEIARHKLRLTAKMPEKSGKPLLDFFGNGKQ
jgi:hypothetical protein